MTKTFLVQTHSSDGQLLHSTVWDSEAPMGLGHPLNWILETTDTGVRILDLRKLSIQEFAEKSLHKKSYPLGTQLEIKILPVLNSPLDQTIETVYQGLDQVNPTDENTHFKKSVTGSILSLGAFLIFSLLISPLFKPKEEPLIPPQFAKMILTPPLESTGGHERFSKNAEDSKRPTNLVHTFKSAAIQRSTQNLLKGFLPHADLLANRRTASTINKLFDSGLKNNSFVPLSKQEESRTVSVNTLGGETETGAGGNSTGYGKGERANLKVQTHTFVSLETPDSVVEEGLRTCEKIT